MITRFSKAMLNIKQWRNSGEKAVDGWRLDSRSGEAAPELYKWDSGKKTFYAIKYRGVWHNCPTFADVRKTLNGLGYTGALPNEPENISSSSGSRRRAEDNNHHYRTAEGEYNHGSY